MNILIFFMSKLSGTSEPVRYNSDSISIEGMQTNEAAAKHLIHCLSEKEEKLDKIIAITSREAKDKAAEVFSNGVKDFCKNKYNFPQILTIDTYNENGNLSDETVLEKVMGNISSADSVYLDVSGGKRTDVDMILLLMKLVKYKGICLKDAFYSSLDTSKGEKKGTISSHNAFYRYLDILDGVNQFAVTGRTDQLSEYFSSFPKTSIERRLLGVMEEFSESIILCNISLLDDILKRMKSLMKEVSDTRCEGMDGFLFSQLFPVFYKKFFGTSEEPDYCHIIIWCLENHLIQQAVTIYIEKIPKYLFDKKMIAATDELKKQVSDVYSKPEQLNIEKELFFSRLMSANGLSVDEEQAKSLVDELIKALKFDNICIAKNERVRKAVNLIQRFQQCCIDKRDCPKAIKSLVSDSKADVSLKAIAELLYGKNINCKPYGVAKYLIANEPVLRAALGLPQKNNNADETIEKKVRTVRNIMTMKIPEGFSVNISREQLRVIMLGYMYSRSIRNRINHAADKNNTTSNLDALLKAYGFDVAFREKVIVEQLEKSVNYILNVDTDKTKTGENYALSH